VDIREIKVGDLVYTFDADGEMMATVVSSVHRERYNGDMIRRRDNGIYMSFTPNHKLAIAWPSGQNALVPFNELHTQADVKRYISRWEGEDATAWIAEQSKAINVRPKDYLKLIGWWLACGKMVQGKRMLVLQTAKARERLMADFADIEVPCIHNRTGVMLGCKFGANINKMREVPRELMNAPADVLRALLSGLIGGSGIWRRPSTEAVFRTRHRALANDVCEIGVKLGFSVSVKEFRLGAAGKTSMLSVVLTPGRDSRIHTGHTKGSLANVDRVPFKGDVYCIEVPSTHSFILRQRGCVWLSGNSDSLLLSFAKGVGQGYGKAYRGILFRKEFGDLDDIVRKVETIFPKLYGNHFRFLKSKSEYVAQWDTGEALLLRNLPNVAAYDEYHGHSYVWIGFEELTQWEDDKAYRLMFSCARSPAPGVPVVGIRATTNPYGVGHNWVKKRFRLPQGFGKVIRRPGEVARVALQSDLRENFVLLHTNPDYPNIIRQAASNPAQAKAWLEGDWNVTTGGMFDDVWDANIHVIPNIPPSMFPAGWRLNRSYDHGQSRPFCVLWWAESNGEPVKLFDGRLIGQIPGDLVLFAEWYGTTGEADTGVRMSARAIAQGIIDRQRDWRVSHRVHVGPADTEIYTKDQRGTMRSPADDMEDVGVLWLPADKSSGSRSRGYQMIRGRMAAARPNVDGTREYPGLYVCERNTHWIELVPSAPRDPQNPDELPAGYEDHPVDCTRYRMSSNDNVPWQRGF
jgi:hypothetical protein